MTLAKLDEELRNAQYGLNRAIGIAEDLGNFSKAEVLANEITKIRDLLWQVRNLIDPELIG